MAVTESQVQALIVATVGDVDPATGNPPSPSSNGILAVNMPVLWDVYAAQDAIAPGLRRLYVERHAYRLVLGVIRQQVDVTVDRLTVRQSQQMKGIEDALKGLDDQILTIERRTGAGAPVAATITRTAPVTPDDAAVIPTQIDANDPRYRGDPYRPAFGIEQR